MKPIPIYNFRGDTDDELSTKATHIIDCMTGNPNFPDATPYVTKVQTAKTAFDAARLAAQNGGVQNTALKDQTRKALEAALKDLALYVRLNCKNDLAIMLSSGYMGQKDAEPLPEPGVPENFKVEQGINSGSVIVSVNSYRRGSKYVFEFALETETGEPSWKSVYGPKKQTIRDLIPGKKYMFRAAIDSKSGILNYSEIITKYVA